MENPFLFAAKGLGIAPTFFPKNYQQDFGQKRQRRSFSLRGIFSQGKGGENAFLFFVFLQQLFKLFVKRGILLCGILLCLFRGIFVALELLYQLLGFLQLAVKIRP